MENVVLKCRDHCVGLIVEATISLDVAYGTCMYFGLIFVQMPRHSHKLYITTCMQNVLWDEKWCIFYTYMSLSRGCFSLALQILWEAITQFNTCTCTVVDLIGTSVCRINSKLHHHCVLHQTFYVMVYGYLYVRVSCCQKIPCSVKSKSISMMKPRVIHVPPGRYHWRTRQCIVYQYYSSFCWYKPSILNRHLECAYSVRHSWNGNVLWLTLPAATMAKAVHVEACGI